METVSLDAEVVIWLSSAYKGTLESQSTTAVEAYRRGMEAILESIGGDSFILGGNSPMWPSIGAVHGMRITNDNSRVWQRFVELTEECFTRNWQHKKFWINDPDTVLLQNQKYTVKGPGVDGKEEIRETPVKKNEFLVNAAYTMASGGMVLSGDDIPKLSDDNTELLKRMLPSVEVAAEFDDNIYTVGRAKISDEKTMIYVFNLEDEEKDIKVSLDGCYDVLDHFEDDKLGVCDGEMVFNSFSPHYAKVLICNRTDK